jgi:TRAP-type transport system periplasmic protein
MIRNILLSAATGLGLSLAVAPAAAASWDLANEYPAGSLQGRTAEVFAEALQEKTGGAISVVLHHGGALGFKSVDHFDAVGDGALELASSAMVFWTGIDPIFQLSSLPFLAPTLEDTRRLYDLSREAYASVLDENNQIMLLATPWPSSGIWGNKPFETIEDLSRVRVRTYDVASTETMRNAGASPNQIAWSDVPAQLSTNAIDAVLTSANGGVGVMLWEHQDYFTNVNYASSLQVIHINRDVWNELSDEHQAAVLEAAEVAEGFGWDLLREVTASDFETMRQNGMTVVEAVPEEFSAQLTEAARPFIEDWVERTGERAQNIMDQYFAN